MRILFNIYLELAALPFDIGLCIFFLLKYRDKSEVNRKFIVFAALVTIGTAVDIIDAVMVSNGHMFPVWVMYVINNINYMLATVASYNFVKYIMSYAGRRWENSTGADINRTIMLIYIALLIQNVFTKTIFACTPDGRIISGSLYYLVVYIYPFYYIMFGGIFMLSHSEKYTRGLKSALFLTFMGMVVMYTIQTLVDRFLLVTFFGASIALFVIFLSLETPDYAKLKRTMEELKISRRELEASGIRMAEASRAKSRFLAQMSNEIRTPVNAIMGYSNLILADTSEETTREYSQRVKISAKRLLKFFENVLNYVSDESDEGISRRLPSMAELLEQSEENEDVSGGDVSFLRRAVAGASEIRILVVDDAELNVDLMVRMLRPIGFTVDTAMNGKQAILQVRKFRYDLIFMDHLMPVMDGTAALKQLREEKLCEDTPVIMLTANAIAGEEEKYLKQGFAAYVTKPFTEDAIREVLRKFLPITDSQWMGEAGISEWEELQEKLPTVRVADAREYLLHDIRLYKELLHAFADHGISAELTAAVRKGDYALCRAIIRSQHDCAVMLGAESLARMTDRLEALLKKGEYDILSQKAGAFIAEKNVLAEQIEDI